MRTGHLLLPLFAALLFACGGERVVDTTGPLRIGVILPMTGDPSTSGEESWTGIQLALEDLGKEGWPKGIEWKPILRDEASDKMVAGNNAKLLVENEKAHVLIGSVASGHTAQIAVEAREGEVPLITPASTNDTLTKEYGPFVSRICFKDSWQGAVLANFSTQQGWKNAVAVVDKAQLYSTGLAENFQKVFTAEGGTCRFVYYTTEDTDFANVILNVANEKPDVIFISGYYAQGGPMIRQAGDRWAGIPIIAGDGLDSPDLFVFVGEATAEIYMSSHFAADAPDEQVRAFAQRYEKQYGKLPGAMAALGYDVMLVLADAAKRCENPRDWNALAEAIRTTKGVKCITGVIDLTTPDRTPIKDAVIVKVAGGLKYHATIKANP